MDDIIGSLGVQIEADASDLPGQYDAAVAASENAAERIANAFESVVGIGEALAITEGLKEFGQEALTAYGTVQSVTVGLTQLTKSASDANEIIEQIKTLASTEPFAFPDLAPTVQKMVALGVSAEQIPAVMQAAADASAATGNSFQAVAGSIDRLGLSGTVSARSLTQLGISTQDLGRAMGVSAEEVKAAFLAMDQEDRLNAITEALQKFGGAAKAQADTIAGEWQIFQNKFEEVMVGVGQALAPAVSDILKFGSSVLSVAQQVIDEFNKLPEPIKLVADGIGIAVAAIAPLTAVVGTVGLGIVAMRTALEPLNELLVALGLRSGEAAVAQTAEAAATTAQGAAAVAATAESGALAIAETSVGQAASVASIQLGLFGEELGGDTVIMGEAAVQMRLFGESASEASIEVTASGEAAKTAVFGYSAMDTAVQGAGAAIAGLIAYDIATWTDKNSPAFKSMADEAYNLTQKIYDLSIGIPGAAEAATLWITGALKPGAAAADQLSQSTFLLSQKLGELGIVIPRGSQTMAEWNKALQEAAANYEKTQEGADGYSSSVNQLIAKQEKLNEAEQQAKANLLNVQQLYKDHKVSIDVLNAAYSDYTKALDASNASNVNFKDTLGGLSEEYGKQQATIATLQGTVAQLLASQDGSATQAALLATAEEKLGAAYDVVDKAAAKASESAKLFVGPLTEEQDAANKAAGALGYYGQQAEDLVQHQSNLQTAAQNAKGVFDALTTSTDTSTAHAQATIQALENWAAALKATGGDLNQVVTVVVNGSTIIGKLGDVIKQAKDHVADFNTTTVNVPQVLDRAQQAALGLTTGMQYLLTGTTDTVNVINNKAVPAYQAFTDIHKNLAAGVDAGAAALKKMDDQTTASIANASHATGYFSSLSASVDDVGRAADGAVPAGSRFANQISTVSDDISDAVGNMSRFANGTDVMTGKVAVLGSGMAALDQRLKENKNSWDDISAAIAKAGGAAQDSWGSITGLVVSAATLEGWYANIVKGLIPGLSAGPGVKDQINAYFQAQGYQGNVDQGFFKPNAAQQAAIDANQAGANSAFTAQQSAQASAAKADQSFIQSLIDIGVSSEQASTILDSLKTQSDSTGKSLSSLESAALSSEKASTSAATATSGNTTALNSKAAANVTAATATTQAAAATDSLTTSTTDLTTAVGALNSSSTTVTDALGNVSTTYSTTAAAQQSFVDGLGNVYNSYQALVDAIRNNPLLAGPAVSQSGTGVVGSGPSTAPQQAFKDALGNVYSSYQDLQAAIAKNPLLAGAAQSSGPLQTVTPASGGTNQTFTVGGRQVSMSEYLDSLGSSGGFSGGASAGTSPTGPGFGLPSSNLSNQSGAAIVVNLHYPQFNTQQQAQQVISQVVQQLRTTAGLKL